MLWRRFFYLDCLNGLSNTFLLPPFRRRAVLCPVFVNCNNFIIRNFEEKCHMKGQGSVLGIYMSDRICICPYFCAFLRSFLFAHKGKTDWICLPDKFRLSSQMPIKRYLCKSVITGLPSASSRGVSPPA